MSQKNSTFKIKYYKENRKFKIGDHVWAKLKGYPPWPAIIVEPPEGIKKNAPQTSFCIFFFGSRDYNFLNPAYLVPYEEYKDELAKGAKSALMTAIKEMEDYKSGDKSVLVMNSSDKTKQCNPGKKKVSFSEDESSTKFPDVSSSEESNSSSTFKKKTVKSHQNSLTKQQMKNDEVLRKRSSPKKRLSTTPLNESKTKRKAIGLNGARTHKDTSSTFEENINWSLSPSPPTSDGCPENPPKEIQTFSATKVKNIIPLKLKIGFIVGVGTVGSNIVKHLLNTGHSVSVFYTRKSDMMKDLIGAKVSKTLTDLASSSDITFCCVPNDETVLDIIFKDDGLIHGMCEGKSFVALSGISTDTSKDISEAIVSRGGRYLEVCLQGDRKNAEAGTLILMAAGDRRVYDDFETCFESFSKQRYFVGELGNAIKTNYIIQLIAGITLIGTAEAAALTEKCKLNFSSIITILANSKLNSSFNIEKSRAIHENRFNTDVSLATVHNDIKNAVNSAYSLNQPLILGSTANEVFKHTKKLGYDDNYDSTLVYFGVK